MMLKTEVETQTSVAKMHNSPLYVSRLFTTDTSNRSALIGWAAEVGLKNIKKMLHVTVFRCRTPVSWSSDMTSSSLFTKSYKIDKKLRPSPDRSVEIIGRFVILKFLSYELSKRQYELENQFMQPISNNTICHMTLCNVEDQSSDFIVEDVVPFFGGLNFEAERWKQFADPYDQQINAKQQSQARQQSEHLFNRI